MKSTIISNVQSINIEDIPDEFLTDELYDKLDNNGGNVIYVDVSTKFSDFLVANGFKFTKSWERLVIFR